MSDLTFRVDADIASLKKALASARREASAGLAAIGGVGSLLTGAGIVVAAQNAISSYVDRSKDIARLAQLANSSIAEASQLLATGEQFGVTSDKFSDALRNVSQAASKNPDDFKAIGVALTDTEGKARRNIDIFTDVRRTLSAGANDYRTTAAAAKILGRSVEDLYPYLRASEAQVQSVSEAAQTMGLVMSEENVKAALEFAGSMRLAGAQADSFVGSIIAKVLPWLTRVIDESLKVTDRIGASKDRRTWRITEEDSKIPVIGGIANLIGNAADAAFGVPSEQAREIDAYVDKRAQIRADWAKLIEAQLLAGGSGSISLPDLGGSRGRDTAADAMKDHIDAIKAEAAAKEQAARDELETYDRTRAAALDTARKVADAWDKERHRNIDGIREEAAAAQKATQDRVDQMRSQIAEREKQRNAAIAAIRAEMAADDDAFNAREAGRNAERDALNEQLREMDQAKRLEQRATELQAAEDDVAKAKAGEPVRVRSESLAEFQKRHDDWVQQVADAEKHLAEVQKSQADDVAREQIDDKLRAIDEASKADRKAADERKKAHEDEIARIQQESAADQDKTDAVIANLEATSKAQQEAFDAQVKRLSDEADIAKAVSDAKLEAYARETAAHDQQVADNLKALARETDETVAELQRQLELHQRNAQSISNAYPNIERTITAAGPNLIAAAGGFDGIVTPGPLSLAGVSDLAGVTHSLAQGMLSGAGSGLALPTPDVDPRSVRVYLDGREISATVSDHRL